MNYAMMGNTRRRSCRSSPREPETVHDGERGKTKIPAERIRSISLSDFVRSDGQYDDAYVDYKNTYDLVPNFPGLGRDLWRLAVLNENDDDAEKWDQVFHLTKADHDIAMVAGPKSGRGEIIVLYENGISPIKKPNPKFTEVPKFYPRSIPSQTQMWSSTAT